MSDKGNPNLSLICQSSFTHKQTHDKRCTFPNPALMNLFWPAPNRRPTRLASRPTLLLRRPRRRRLRRIIVGGGQR